MDWANLGPIHSLSSLPTLFLFLLSLYSLSSPLLSLLSSLSLSYLSSLSFVSLLSLFPFSLSSYLSFSLFSFSPLLSLLSSLSFFLFSLSSPSFPLSFFLSPSLSPLFPLFLSLLSLLLLSLSVFLSLLSRTLSLSPSLFGCPPTRHCGRREDSPSQPPSAGPHPSTPSLARQPMGPPSPTTLRAAPRDSPPSSSWPDGRRVAVGSQLSPREPLGPEWPDAERGEKAMPASPPPPPPSPWPEAAEGLSARNASGRGRSRGSPPFFRQAANEGRRPRAVDGGPFVSLPLSSRRRWREETYRRTATEVERGRRRGEGGFKGCLAFGRRGPLHTNALRAGTRAGALRTGGASFFFF